MGRVHRSASTRWIPSTSAPGSPAISQEVHFKDGQLVKRGDLLFTIDSRPFERTVDQARAELAQARTKVENSARDVDRGRPLVERKVMSEKVFDDRANLKREAEAALKVAEAKVRTAELELEFTRMTAPLAGRIGRAMISVGNFVTAGGGSNPTLLATIVSLDPINLYFDVSEANALKYRRLTQGGQKAGVAEEGTAIEFALPDETGFPHRGKIDYSDIRLDPGTSTLRARAVVANPNGLFSPGMFARARLAGSPSYQALLLPDEAIGADQASRFVWVVAEDGTVSRRIVTLGPVVAGMRAVRTGVTQDDWVIVKGIQRARQGQKVIAEARAAAVLRGACTARRGSAADRATLSIDSPGADAHAAGDHLPCACRSSSSTGRSSRPCCRC